jgi:hypothetical protein
MFAELLNMFHMSPQGQNAMGVLQQQGWSPDQTQQILGAALPAAANGMHMATQGHPEPAVGLFNIFGGHAGGEFLTGAITGLLRGDGIFGSFKDGAMGMIGGHIAEVIAQRTGMNPQMAGQVAAALSPFIMHYAHERLSSHPAVQQQFGAAPGGGGGFTPAFAPQGGGGGFTPQGAGGFGGGGGFTPQGGGSFGAAGFTPQDGGFTPQGGGYAMQQGGAIDPTTGQPAPHHHHHHHHHQDGGDKYSKG